MLTQMNTLHSILSSPTTLTFIIRLVLLSLVFNLGLSATSKGQDVQRQALKGVVMDLMNDNVIPYTFIQNLTSGTRAETNEEGEFEIQAKPNDLLRFFKPGYRVDSILVVEFGIKRVYLTPTGESIRIEQIEIFALTDQQLDYEIERLKNEGKIVEVSKNQGGLRISPSRAFGKSGKLARERYELLLAEKDKRLVKRRFSKQAIQALTPLEGEELTEFMAEYAPDAEFAQRASEESFMLYILDSFAEFNRKKKQK